MVIGRAARLAVLLGRKTGVKLTPDGVVAWNAPSGNATQEHGEFARF